MITLLGSLLGFGTSFLPKVMDYIKDKADKKHELAMIAAQAEAQAKIQEAQLQITHVEADIRETEAIHKEQTSMLSKASPWVATLSASVRPVITYLFFFEFLILTLGLNLGWIDTAQYNQIWSQEMQAIWAAVISFWFGQRTMAKWGKAV